ncbi:MAG: glutathione S-transferase family protein, partial [Gammaproteobacteria bacterium]|nr:glutathione S-transferase family protein [Gammaproteobacteria bacterium]
GGETRRAPFTDLNPSGKVPVIQDDSLVLSESAAICNWIGLKAPDAGLVPADGSRERAHYDQWCSFAVSELEQPMWLITRHSYVLPKEYRVPKVRDSARYEFAQTAAVLETGLGEREFIVGDRFTMADLLLAHSLGWARLAKCDVPDRLRRYANAIVVRPAYQRARDRERAVAEEVRR